MEVNSIKNQISSPSLPNLRKEDIGVNVRFNGKNDSSQSEEKKSGFSVKKATNVAAVAMWLAIVGAGIYRTGLFQKKHPENIAKKAKNIKEQFKDLKEGLGNNDKEVLKDQKFGTKLRDL